jgi:hypothetical protein
MCRGARRCGPLVRRGTDRTINTTLPLAVAVQQHLNASEQTIGFRLTPEVTLRASHRLVERFGTTEFGHTGAVSIVWYRRWM